MKFTEYSRYCTGFVDVPVEKRFSHTLKAGMNPDEQKRYRFVAVIGRKTNSPLILDINMFLRYSEAAVIDRCLNGELVEEDDGNWARRSRDVASEMGRACSFDEGLKKRLMCIIKDYVRDEDSEIHAIADMISFDLERMCNGCDQSTLEDIVVFLLTVTKAIEFYSGSLELVEEPIDEYDFVIKYEDDGAEAEHQRYCELVYGLHPELLGDEEMRTITITDAMGNVFEHVETSVYAWRRVENGVPFYKAMQNEAISFLAKCCVEDQVYADMYVECFAKSLDYAVTKLGFAWDEKTLREMNPPIERDVLDEDELWKSYYRVVDGVLHAMQITDDQTGKTYTNYDWIDCRED